MDSKVKKLQTDNELLKVEIGEVKLNYIDRLNNIQKSLDEGFTSMRGEIGKLGIQHLVEIGEVKVKLTDLQGQINLLKQKE